MNKKVKVVFVIPGFGPGGAQRVLSVLLDHLDRSRFQPVCVVYDDQKVYAIPDDVKIYCLSLPGTDSVFKKFYYAVIRILKLRKIFIIEKPEVIFSFISRVNLIAIIAWLLLKNTDIKARLIITVRGYLSFALKGKLFKTLTFLIKILYPKADKIIVNAEIMKIDLIHNFSLPAEKIDVIYNPLDIEKIKELSMEQVEHVWFNENTPVVINVGSLVEAKAQEYLLKAFKIVREKHICRLVILGEGEKEIALKRLSVELGIDNDVAFLGFQNNPFKYVSKASVFVLSSRWEGFPNALIEAMACGVPVISTRCPSGPEEIIKDSVNGLLVPVENEEKLAEAVIKVLSDSGLALKIALEAERRVLQFDVKTVLGSYENLFVVKE